MLQHGVHGGFRHKVIKKHEKWNPQENPLEKTLKGTMKGTLKGTLKETLKETLKGTLKETENSCSTGKLFFLCDYIEIY